MLHLISAGKNTQLHSFPDLATLHTYPHPNDVRQNLHHAPDANLFVMCNPEAATVELMRRTVRVGTGDALQRVRKVLLNDVSCAACSWGRCAELAVGLNSGMVQFFDIKRAELTAVKFRPENARQSVVSLAYSSCNELLGSVYADGEINIFGLKTTVKMDNFHLDRGSTLIRFHPTRRYHAAIASEKGAVTVMDVSAKRTVYAEKHAHASPCPDVCWSPTDPNLLLSAGFDCQLCVFDVRQRHIVHQIRNASPFSCCAVARTAAGGTAAGGPYVAAGTLKGDLCAYDLRSLRDQLAQRKAVHAAQVVRVAFAGDVSAGRTDRSGGSGGGGGGSSEADSTAVPNILGGGRRSMEVRTAVAAAAAPSRPSAAAYQRRLSTDVRASVGGGGGGGSRPSLAAVSGSGGSVDGSSDIDDDQNSFNAFLNKCTRRRESFPSGGGGGGGAGRRDSLLDMEVRPVRFADISDSEFSGTTGGGSRRASLVSVTETTPEPKAPVPRAPPQRRTSLRPGGVGSVILEGTDDDDCDGDIGDIGGGGVLLARRSASRDHPNVTSRSKAKAKATAQELSKIEAWQRTDSPGMPAAVYDDDDADLSNKENHATAAAASSPIGSRKPVAAAAAGSTLLAVANNSTHSQTLVAAADLERLIDDRLGAMADRLEARLAARNAEQAERLAEVSARVEAMHFAVQTHLWVLEDTDLLQLRTGVAETLEAVRMLALSSEFVQAFVAVKEENGLLRRQLALERGEPAPGKFM